jgi:hypothetical protein
VSESTEHPALDTYRDHGAELDHKSGDERYGASPFNDKQKFYANVKTGAWHDHVPGEGRSGGHVPQFLERIAKQYAEDLDDERLRALADDRGLPVSAFRPWELGWDGENYTVAVHDIDGKVVDIRRHRLGSKKIKWRSTKNADTGLLGAHRLKRSKGRVYICEGESDAIALRWLLQKVEAPGIVLAVPGAGTFKKQWVRWLAGRKVYLLYDNDDAGEQGEQRAHALLVGQASRVRCLHWPDGTPDQGDVRDFIIRVAIKQRQPAESWDALREMFRGEPRLGPDENAGKAGAILEQLKQEWLYCYETKCFVYIGANRRRAYYELDKESFSDRYADEFRGGANREAARQMLTSGCTKVARPAYLPNKPQVTHERAGGTSLPVVNLWIPSGLDTSQGGDISPYREHVEFVIPDATVRQTVLDSFAFWCRSPEVKTNWAIFLGGKAGIGKDAVVWPVKETLGQHNVGMPSPDDLESGYTDWLNHRKLIVVDTLRFVGKQHLMDRMKPMIASPPERLRINGKYKAQYEIANLVAFFFMANRDDALALDEDDRRFFVYWSDAKPKPPSYYPKFWDWMREHAGAIGHYFLHEHNISEHFEPLTPPPVTDAKQEMIAANKTPLTQLLRAAWEEVRAPMRTELVVMGTIEEYFDERRKSVSTHSIGAALREMGAVKLKQRPVMDDGAKPYVWALTNFKHYDAMSTEELKREYLRQKQARIYRSDQAKKKPLTIIRRKS